MFQKVVELYRKLERPDIDQGVFSFSGIATTEIQKLIEEVDNLPKHFGEFLTKDISNNFIEIEFSLPATEHGRFHNDVSSFLKATPSLETGTYPDQYYICDLDYYSQDDNAPIEIKNLKKIIELIKLLSELSHETANSEYQATNRLVFVLAANGKSPAKTFSIRTKIAPDLLEISLQHLNFLHALLSKERREQIHVEERKMIMQMAIADVLSTFDEADSNLFSCLVKNWNLVISTYRHNFQSFLHEYSFEKVRKDIASSEVEHATKLSSVLGDITGKALALPISLGGIILLREAKTIESAIVIALGLLIVTLVLISILINQWLQVDRIRNSFHIIFSQYTNKLEKYPRSLREPIVSSQRKIIRQQRVLMATFIFIGILSLLPLLGSIYILLDKYNINIIDYINNSYSFIRDFFIFFEKCKLISF